MTVDRSELVREVETLGEAGQYDGQAQAFLWRTGTKIEAKYSGTRSQFGEKDEPRDVYDIRMKRGSREYSFSFGTSINDTEDRIRMLDPHGSPNQWREIRRNGGRPSFGSSLIARRVNKWEEEHKEWVEVRDVNAGQRPSAYSILACLQSYEPPQNIDDFAAEFGYEKPSEAIRVFEAVKKEWTAVHSLFTDDEIRALQAIS